MAAKLLKTERFSLPASRFIGRRYTGSDRQNETFGHLWQEWFEKELFPPLEALGSLAEHGGAYAGLMRPQNGELEYWIGMFFPEQTAVPPGYESAAAAAGDFALCYIYGNEQNGEIYGEQPHRLCLASIAEHGWRYQEGGWFFERYSCPRFTAPDEAGNVILDYGFALVRN